MSAGWVEYVQVIHDPRYGENYAIIDHWMEAVLVTEWLLGVEVESGVCS